MVYEMIVIGYGNYIAKARVIAAVTPIRTGAPFDTGCGAQSVAIDATGGADESRHRMDSDHIFGR